MQPPYFVAEVVAVGACPLKAEEAKDDLFDLSSVGNTKLCIMIFPTFSFVSGVIVLQQMARLPAPLWMIAALLATIVVFPFRKYRPAGWFLLGWIWAFGAAALAMQNRLDPALEGKDLLVEGRISGIPQFFDYGVRFGFEIDTIDGVADRSFPGKVRLSWYSSPFEFNSGERWRFQVRLKQPHGSLNPGGFDYEQWLYLQGFHATGTVRQRFANKRLEDAESSVSMDRLRESIAERLAGIFETSPVSGIIQALVVGEQHDISQQQWEVFRITGTTHLVAISGQHIGLVAGLAFLIAKWLWLRIGSVRVSAPSVAAVCAIGCAMIYSALAGFSLPTQRAMIMISLVMGAILLRRKVLSSNTLALALFLIVLYDPTSVLAPGLWLSFTAVWLIIYTLSGRIAGCGRWLSIGKVHIITAIGLAPLLLLYFQQISLIAPLANLLAVPVISLLVVPCCLAGSILLLIIPKAGILLLEAAGFTLEMLWVVLEMLSRFSFAQWSGNQPAFLYLILAFAGLLLLFAPRGIPARWLGVLMLLPIVFAPLDPAPDKGEFRFTLLDVGQGLAAVVETANHTLVFDTGARISSRFDMGSAVVAPFLRSRNIRSINRLVISHADNDHIGGARSLNKLIPIEQILTSSRPSIDWRGANECKAGQTWTWDGIEFQMLAPLDKLSERKNDNSCVLRVQSRSHSILLTGDIEKSTERALVEQYGTRLASDYLVVPHHGSNTSSTTDFLEAVNPKYALIPAGYRNRYRFPRREVIARIERAGAKIYNTANSGAIFIWRDPQNPHADPLRYRAIAEKYYHFHAPGSGRIP